MKFKSFSDFTKEAIEMSNRQGLPLLVLMFRKLYQFHSARPFPIWNLWWHHLNRRARGMAIGLAGILMVLFMAMPGSSVAADRTAKADIDSDAMGAAAPCLRVLPPLGKDRMKKTLADRTLTDFLVVSIYEIDQSVPAYEFTSQKIQRGMGYIKSKKRFYHANWNIAKADAGKTFEIHFAVAGLDIGQYVYTPPKGRTMPIRFQIDTTPRIRAHMLHEQGYSALEIARVLIQEFNMDASDIVQILYLEGFTASVTGEIIHDLFGHDALAAAQMLKDTGFSTAEIALMLNKGFGLAELEAAQALFDLGFGPDEITQAARDVFELDAYNTGLILKELGFNEYTIQGLLIEVYQVYAAIVDIASTINDDPAQGPPGYTGLAFCSDGTRCTSPYIPGLLGQLVTPNDINKGIGGDFRYVYVKYELVSKTSDQPVVTGIKAAHWPYWDEPFPCGEGWTPVSPLTTTTLPWTTGSIGSCDRIGLCALYEPFKDAEKFITTAAISYGDFGNPASKCSAVGGSNANVWPLYTDALDIHRGCEDEHWVFFCYDQARKWPVLPTTIEISDEEKFALLEQYAPRVFLAPELYQLYPAERFYPSSVEWSFDHLVRYSPDDLPDGLYDPVAPFSKRDNLLNLFPKQDARYYVHPRYYWDQYHSGQVSSLLDWSPSDWLEYHRGCDGSATDNPCHLSDAPAYAFWNTQTIPWGGENIAVADLTYFFYFPYNRGKEYLSTVWESHIGDWEHLTVRLSWVYHASTGWELEPIHMFVAAHNFGTSHPWDTISKVTDTDHPIVYSAEGSHGVYVTAGNQRYGKIDEVWPYIFLYDYTGEGAQWDTWNNLETFDYDEKHGLGTSSWPQWMSTDYTAACDPDNPGCDPADPASGPIYRWGTYRFGCEEVPFLGIDIACRMEVGPTGPADKGIWDDPYEP